ncbi:MAG: glycosyltransferase [Okeania sp. SIO3B5]|uniref:glycosyltransferase n=1 Tax=Okeania sp. SIO3B5 TaxID=2607811 RepID=UPI0013FEF15C|nr:glycosyltransferase [Okeania sp. SIO3B5]NEO52714.1 glycosyltransferase [Okeania sp. SIO3B5]
MSEKTKLLATLGSLDKVEFDRQELLLIGWVVSRNLGVVKSFQLTIADTEIENFETALNLPSPDVRKLHPNLHNSDKARFRIKAFLNPEQISQFQNAEIALTPIFKHGKGQVLSKVLDNPTQITFSVAPIIQEQPKFIPPIEPITTIGHLDKVAKANQKLIISGWVGSYNFGSVESFKVFIGSQEFTSFEQKLGLPSPDVAKARTKLNNAENARFSLEIPLTKAELQNCQNTLITLTPIFQGKEGEILFQLFNPSLPIPDDKYIEGKAINFIQRSCKFLGDFIQRVGLQPTAEVLEIGCRVGNIAYGLAYYLKSPGCYEGNDFSEELISWAQQNISNHKPHFNFRQIDSDLKLPYDDKSFDFVFIGSRFTQVGGKEIRNYLDEIYRVLKPDGRFLFQCFLVNHESEQLISEGKSSQPLIHRVQEGFTKDLNSPEKGMGFLESLLLEWVINAGFNVLGKYYGSWCGRVGKRSYPDMVILEKEEVRINQEKIESLVKEEVGNKQSENLQELEKIDRERSSEEVRVNKEKIDGLVKEEVGNKQSENLQELEKIDRERSSEEVRVNQEKIDGLVKEEVGNKQSENLQELEKIDRERSSEEVRVNQEKIDGLVKEEVGNKQSENLQELEKIDSDRSEVLQNNLPSESTVKITPESKSSVSPLLAEIMADLEKSQIEIQEIQADLEKFKSQREDIPVKSLFPVEPDTSITTKKKLLTKPLEEVTQKSKLPTPPPKQKQELLGLSGVTVDKFWEIILVEGRRKKEEGRRDFSDIEGRSKKEEGKRDFSDIEGRSKKEEGRGDFSESLIEGRSKKEEGRGDFSDIEGRRKKEEGRRYFSESLVEGRRKKEEGKRDFSDIEGRSKKEEGRGDFSDIEGRRKKEEGRRYFSESLVEGRRKKEEGRRDFSDIEGRSKKEEGKRDFSESLIEGRRDDSKPSISILTPTWNSSLDWFVETVLSVLNQSIPNWEWCIVDDGSKQPEIRNILAGLTEKEPRIKVLLSEDNGGISAATNKALNMATGEYICLLDHDDTLAPTALEDSLNKLAEGFDVVYSDEDKIDFSGLNYIVPFFKPDWSPEYFRGVMYVGHLLCVRRELALTAGGFKSEFDGVQDYEFMLRVSEQTNKIAHISRHLYHWRQVKGSISGDADAKAGIEVVQQAAVNSHLQRIGLAAKAEPGLGKHRININPLPRNNHPLISLIIAAPNLSENIDKWSQNLLSVSTYPKNEVILVGGEKTENIIQNSAVKVLNLSGKFNYSRAYNLAAKTAQGEYFIFLNTNLEVVTEDWQRHLLYYAEQSDIGAVGGLLIFPDGIVEHAGIVLGKSGKVDYVMRGFPTNHDGYAGSLVCAREVSAVSRDCLMVSRQNFEMVGGFNEHFFSDYQDVDLCLKLRKNGKRIVFTPRSVLINHQSEKHRQRNYDVVDYMLLLDQWQIDMDLGDPYYNLNFDIQRNDYTVVL